MSGAACGLELSPELARLQKRCFHYLHKLANPQNGLVPDTSAPGAPASVAVVGMALTAWCIGVERGWMKRSEAKELTLAALGFFSREAPAQHGLFYHFMDMKSGARVWNCELSSVDSALFLLGVLAVGSYFDANTREEARIRSLAQQLVDDANWQWMTAGGATIRLGWKPERGFLVHGWEGFNEALPMQILALGSPGYALSADFYQRWCSTYKFKSTYGYTWAYCGPLFTHLFPHMWLDLRARTDAVMGRKGLNYFQNTRNAILVQNEYAHRNPRGRAGYSNLEWGLSACDGPDRKANDTRGYHARGVPFGMDDGTLSPPVAVAAFPFCPDLAVETHLQFLRSFKELEGELGLRGAVHPGLDWTCTPYYGLDQGMLCILLENARSGLVWQVMERTQAVQRGLGAAGFTATRAKS